MNSFQILLTSLSLFALSYLNAFSAADLTIEEKIGQLLMVHFHGSKVNAAATELVQDLYIGHIIYYNWANGLTSPTQIKQLSSDLQDLATKKRVPIPLIIAVDQEGGVVTRLQNGFTVFPGNRAIASTNDPDLAEQCAHAIGIELKAVGINMNLAPVVDINSNPFNPVIGIRSFGENPNQTAIYSEKALKGYQKARVIASLKHYPGHGDVFTDSHSGLPFLNKSLVELERSDLIPFSHLAKKCEVIMTGHLLVPALDPHACTTLSAPSLSYLRNELGFDGVIISDSLVMEGVRQACGTVEKTCIEAINAGCDILLLGGKLMLTADDELKLDNIRKIHTSLVEAVKNNQISEERLNSAVNRILNLKNNYLSSSNEEITFDRNPHISLARTIAKAALKWSRITENPINLDEKKVVVLVPKSYTDSCISNTLSTRTNCLLHEYDEFTKHELFDKTDILLLFSYNSWKNPALIEWINSIGSKKFQKILIPMRDPCDALLVNNFDGVLFPFSPTVYSVEAAMDFLFSQKSL